jgi:hypothetical protein
VPQRLLPVEHTPRLKAFRLRLNLIRGAALLGAGQPALEVRFFVAKGAGLFVEGLQQAGVHQALQGGRQYELRA